MLGICNGGRGRSVSAKGLSLFGGIFLGGGRARNNTISPLPRLISCVCTTSLTVMHRRGRQRGGKDSHNLPLHLSTHKYILIHKHLVPAELSKASNLFSPNGKKEGAALLPPRLQLPCAFLSCPPWTNCTWADFSQSLMGTT